MSSSPYVLCISNFGRTARSSLLARMVVENLQPVSTKVQLLLPKAQHPQIFDFWVIFSTNRIFYSDIIYVYIYIYIHIICILYILCVYTIFICSPVPKAWGMAEYDLVPVTFFAFLCSQKNTSAWMRAVQRRGDKIDISDMISSVGVRLCLRSDARSQLRFRTRFRAGLLQWACCSGRCCLVFLFWSQV